MVFETWILAHLKLIIYQRLPRLEHIGSAPAQKTRTTSILVMETLFHARRVKRARQQTLSSKVLAATMDLCSALLFTSFREVTIRSGTSLAIGKGNPHSISQSLNLARLTMTDRMISLAAHIHTTVESILRRQRGHRFNLDKRALGTSNATS